MPLLGGPFGIPLNVAAPGLVVMGDRSGNFASIQPSTNGFIFMPAVLGVYFTMAANSSRPPFPEDLIPPVPAFARRSLSTGNSYGSSLPLGEIVPTNYPVYIGDFPLPTLASFAPLEYMSVGADACYWVFSSEEPENVAPENCTLASRVSRAPRPAPRRALAPHPPGCCGARLTRATSSGPMCFVVFCSRAAGVRPHGGGGRRPPRHGARRAGHRCGHGWARERALLLERHRRSDALEAAHASLHAEHPLPAFGRRVQPHPLTGAWHLRAAGQSAATPPPVGSATRARTVS